ncbi:MAG: DegT/DnrJ/EryC1/StrS family aminotransferase [Bacteroidia bacterium]|nr:DegT/DnrJ/EryC1/StrS family aminotransferase [Bacteroidia bacterium]
MQESKTRSIPISLPSMGQEEWEILKKPIESGWITQGPFVAEFERLFAVRHNVKHAIAVSNCTTALHLALLALGIGEGDEVIVPAFTWVATANAVLYCRAKPILVDIDISTFNIDINKIEKVITPQTKAIIPVHLFGLCADVPAIRNKFPWLKVVEDGACAAGAGINSLPAGSLGHIGCFSFHPRKSVTTGEGGMLTTNDDELAEKLNRLRNHGASVSEEQRHKGPRPYILPAFEIVGYNYRMTDLQGAVGVVQLKKLDAFIEERNYWATYYTENLSKIKWLKTPYIPEGYKHGWQSYVLLIDEAKSPMKRNELMEYLQQKGISTRPGTHAVHMLDVYKRMFGYCEDDFPNAKTANNCSIAIPLHNRMTKEDYEHVVESFISLKK